MAKRLRTVCLATEITHASNTWIPVRLRPLDLSVIAVTSPSAHSLIDLHQLRLDDARALLRHGHCDLPDVEISPQTYVQTVIDRLCDLSLKDPLTGLANRRYFHNVLAREIEVVARSGEPALLLMLDIDHFKHINDTHGHPAGDLVLQAVAKTLAACVRPMDTVARFGGEEFVIVLPSCQGHYGLQVAERIRELIGSLNIKLATGSIVKATISVGGAYAPRWVRSTQELWLERADLELYRAKSEGRNRVCIEQQPIVAVSAEEKHLLFGSLSLGDPAWMEGVPTDGPVGSSANAVNRVN